MPDELRPRLHQMTVERAAELQRYVATEKRVLGEARDREALKMERGADFNTWLSDSVSPIVDPLLRRSQQQYPGADRGLDCDAQWAASI